MTAMTATIKTADSLLRQTVAQHPAAGHALFAVLNQARPTVDQAGSFLRNYDAHASHLRRLLLKAATIMPEKAVGFILENVRNEYGNGNVDGRHQLQLQDLAWQIGLSRAAYNGFAVQPGIRRFIKDVTPYYYPLGKFAAANKVKETRTLTGTESETGSDISRPIRSRAAVAAGAITATELMAVEEFKSMQKAFCSFGLEHHIWFDHVTIECEHLEDSVNLALFFLDENPAFADDVLFGLKGVLDANMHLYDGLLACIDNSLDG